MLLSDVFERFVEKEPINVMARTIMEVALAPAELNALFESCSEQQYTRSLLFSVDGRLDGTGGLQSPPIRQCLVPARRSRLVLPTKQARTFLA